MPLKYFGDNDTVVTGRPSPRLALHAATDHRIRPRPAARWSWKRLILIALAGTIPFLSFVAERSATKDVRRKLAPQEAEESAAALTSEIEAS